MYLPQWWRSRLEHLACGRLDVRIPAATNLAKSLKQVVTAPMLNDPQQV